MLHYDKELSRRIAQTLKGKIETKGCYQNAYRIADCLYTGTPSQGTINLLFCYAPFHHGIYVRHAFCLVDDRLIEPLPNLGMDTLDVGEIVPIRRMDMDEYHALLVDEGCYDLCGALHDDEMRVLNESRIDLNPIDLSDLLRREASSTKEFVEMLENWYASRGLPVPDGTVMEQTQG